MYSNLFYSFTFRHFGIQLPSHDFYMQNYVSIGVDALVTYNFHKARESPFYLISSRIINKLIYFRWVIFLWICLYEESTFMIWCLIFNWYCYPWLFNHKSFNPGGCIKSQIFPRTQLLIINLMFNLIFQNSQFTSLTLIGMRGDTFRSLSFMSAEFFQRFINFQIFQINLIDVNFHLRKSLEIFTVSRSAIWRHLLKGSLGFPIIFP